MKILPIDDLRETFRVRAPYSLYLSIDTWRLSVRPWLSAEIWEQAETSDSV